MAAPEITFDKGPISGGTHFSGARRLITAWNRDELEPAFAQMQDAQQSGNWLAGYAGYELGHCLDPKLAPLVASGNETPLLAFGVFDAPGPSPKWETGGHASLSSFEPAWNFAQYKNAFDRVHAHIRAGDIYQANLTFPLHARLDGEPRDLYAQLSAHQPVPYGAFVNLGEHMILSRSPELFFRADARGQLSVKPMKGTMRRGHTPKEDEALRIELEQSIKNRAENLMIVDLLRNDLSRISEIGSVRVPRLFDVEAYATVFQMTSTIQSQMRSGVSLYELFTALFPCGSVTGAPKLRAMEIINETEIGPRGPYCGSIGWIAPDGAMEFNVAIRSIRCHDDRTATLNVGGGIVYDSNAADEYDEAILKAKFAQVPQTPSLN